MLPGFALKKMKHHNIIINSFYHELTFGTIKRRLVSSFPMLFPVAESSLSGLQSPLHLIFQRGNHSVKSLTGSLPILVVVSESWCDVICFCVCYRLWRAWSVWRTNYDSPLRVPHPVQVNSFSINGQILSQPDSKGELATLRPYLEKIRRT